MKECPELEKEGFRIDKVLAKSLIQAKHYRIKCEVTPKVSWFIMICIRSRDYLCTYVQMSEYEKGLVPQQLANKAMLAAVKDFVPSQLAKFKPG